MITVIFIIVTFVSIVFTISFAITAVRKNKKYKATIGSLTDWNAEDSSVGRSIRKGVNSAEDVLVFSSLGTTILIALTFCSAYSEFI